MSESRVMWATSAPILVFLGLSVLDLGPMHATDRQTSDAHHRLMAPTLGAGAQNIDTFMKVSAISTLYPKVFNPLTAYCILFWYFCVPCAFVMWSINLITYLLTSASKGMFYPAC